MAWPISDQLRTTLATSHTRLVRCDLLADEGTVPLKVIGGSVTIAEDTAVRRSCTVTISDPDGSLTPTALTDVLAPGSEIRLWRGARLPGGVDELVPLGVFGISKVTATGNGQLALTGYDRARRIQRSRITRTSPIVSGTNVADAIRQLAEEGVGGLTFNFATTTHTTGLLIPGTTEDRLELMHTMARTIGHVFAFDPAGTASLRPEPDASVDPIAATLQTGNGELLLQAIKALDDEDTYTHAVVQGEPPDATPVRADAYDGDPSDPDFHDVPVFLTSPLIRTQPQADEAAAALLRRKRGATETVEIRCLPQPHLDAGDTVTAVAGDVAVDGRFVIARLTIPLGKGDMSVGVRPRKI